MAKKPVFIDEEQDRKVETIRDFQRRPKRVIVEDAIDFYYTHVIANKEMFTKFVKDNQALSPYQEIIFSEFSDAPTQVFENIMSLNKEYLKFYHISMPEEKEQIVEILSEKDYDAFLIIKLNGKESELEILKTITGLIKTDNKPEGKIAIGIKRNEKEKFEGKYELFVFVSKKEMEKKEDDKKQV